MFDEFGINAGFVEDLHARYRQSPQSVDGEWRAFFDALTPSIALSPVPGAPPPRQMSATRFFFDKPPILP